MLTLGKIRVYFSRERVPILQYENSLSSYIGSPYQEHGVWIILLMERALLLDQKEPAALFIAGAPWN